MVNRIPSRLWVKSTLGLIAGLPGGDGTPLFLHKTISTWVYKKQDNERRANDGERNSGNSDAADDGGGYDSDFLRNTILLRKDD